MKQLTLHYGTGMMMQGPLCQSRLHDYMEVWNEERLADKFSVSFSPQKSSNIIQMIARRDCTIAVYIFSGSSFSNIASIAMNFIFTASGEPKHCQSVIDLDIWRPCNRLYFSDNLLFRKITNRALLNTFYPRIQIWHLLGLLHSRRWRNGFTPPSWSYSLPYWVRVKIKPITKYVFNWLIGLMWPSFVLFHKLKQ